MNRPVSVNARRVDLTTELPLQIGGARIDPAAYEITIAGVSARMQPQTLKVLIALHDRIGHVVTRDELVDRCWDGRIVGEDVINRCISLLRRIAADPGGFRIETIPRSGYRLIESGQPTPFKLHRLGAVAGIAVLCIALAFAASRKLPQAQRNPPPPTIAVLAFPSSPDNVAREASSSLRDAVSDFLSNSGFPVRLSETESGAPQADYLIAGDVRSSGNVIRATIQMKEIGRGILVYSRQFDEPVQQAKLLPEQAAASIAASLTSTEALIALDRRHPSDPAATKELMQALTLDVENKDPLRAYAIARRAARGEPNSPVAQLALALSTASALGDLPQDQRWSAVVAARAAAERIRSLAPEFGNVYTLWCRLHSPMRIAECEDQLRLGMRIDPDAPDVAAELSSLLNATGRVDEALQLSEESLANDPYNPAKLGREIRLLESVGRERDAKPLFERALRYWPDDPSIFWSRFVGVVSRGHFKATEALSRELGSGRMPVDKEPAAELFRAVDNHDLPGARRACSAERLRWTTSALCITALSRLGDLDRAFAIANRIEPPIDASSPQRAERLWLQQPGGFSISFFSSPATAELRHDPRFPAFAASLGLLDYWRRDRLPDFCTVRHEAVCATIVHPLASLPKERP
jgi:DNA-binding winged helix-turn-helix (wHTH) protein/tetratricopeptide (TPR) repeat protein